MVHWGIVLPESLPPEIEFIDLDAEDDLPEPAVSEAAPARGRRRPLLAAGIAVAAVVALIGWLVITDSSPERDFALEPEPLAGALESPNAEGATRFDGPNPLLAAEAFLARPDADHYADLLAAAGGEEGILVATSFGVFDLVRFDVTRLGSLQFDAVDPTRPLPTIRSTNVADTSGRLFGLTDSGELFTVIDGVEMALAAGPFYGIESPGGGVVVAYPTEIIGLTRVWDRVTRERLDDHPLAGRPYRRVAVSADADRAVGVRADGVMEQVDLATGTIIATFGETNEERWHQPIFLNSFGAIALTVERPGVVALWWVGADTPTLTIDAVEGARPQDIDELTSRSAVAVQPDLERVAIRRSFEPDTPMRWHVYDISIGGWIERACEEAGPALRPTERAAQGLPPGPDACRR